MLIIPAILTNDLNSLTSLLKVAEKKVDRVQIDIIDNKFASNLTVDPAILKNINTFLNLDFHLMVKSPIEWIDHCLRTQTVKEPEDRIIGQIEFMENQKQFVDRVISFGQKAGLAIDLETPIEKLDQEALTKIDILLLMSVKAGFDHQQFDLNIWNKIQKAVKLRSELNLKFKLCLDGGVTTGLVKDMEKLGVDEVAVGKRIFEPDLTENLKLFYNEN